MAVRFEYRFYDFEENLFKVNIFRSEYPADTVYEIGEAGADPVTIRHGGGDKNSLETTVIQGKELEFNFFLPRADIANIEDIFESQYQDYVLEYLDASDNTIFKGYVKPENLTKRYETNPPYIEISLPANDGLLDLSEFDFRDENDDLIIGRESVLSVVKKALRPIAGTVLNFPFKVQLGTYEINLMTSIQCALKEAYVDTRVFLNGSKLDDDPFSCFDVITEVLKPFNVVLRQEGENWVITNPHELDSYEFLFGWDLIQQSRTATSNLLNISDSKYQPYIEEQKIHPLRYAYTTRRYDVTGNEYLPSDEWGDWTFTNFSSVTIDPESEGNNVVQVLSSQTVGGSEPIIELTNPVYLDKISNADSIIIAFDYEFLALIDSNDVLLYFKIEIQRPNGQWYDPIYHEIDFRLHEQLIAFRNSSLNVAEAGNHNIKISLYLKRGWYDGLILALKNPSIQIKPASNRIRNERNRNREDRSSSEETAYGRNRRSTGGIARESTETRETSVEDKEFVLKQENGYEKFEIDLLFGDAFVYPSVRDNAALINVFYSSTSTYTRNWSSYGNTEESPVTFIYSKNIINNRQKYKTYIRTRVYDRNHLIKFTNILVIEGKNYFIAEYDRHYKEGYVELGLIELIVTQIDYDASGYTGGFEEVVLYNNFGEGTIIPPLVTDGETQVTHAFAVGDIVRYDKALSKYVKAQADTADNAKAVGIVSEIIDSDRFKFISEDYVSSDSQLYETLKTKYSLEEGEYYFLSPTASGEMLKSSSLSTSDIEQSIGYVTTKGLKVQIDARNIKAPGVDPYVPRAASQALIEGDNVITYSTAFPAGSTVIVWIYTYDSNGYQVGNRVTNETVTGFTVNVPKVCTLKYIATIAN